MLYFRNLNISLFVLTFLVGNWCYAQQEADTLLVPKISNSKYSIAKGPKIYIDESHNNFHTNSGRFKPFSDLLKQDGYVLDSITDYRRLKKNDVLVISNAIHSMNVGNWRKPIHNAFTESEILFFKLWVENGGNLLLIADHMPFSGASNVLANAFGFHFCDGFAQLNNPDENQPDIFSAENKRLLNSIITDGTFGREIQSITSFTGSSFSIPKEAIGILKFTTGDICLEPEVAWQFNEETIRKNIADDYQGAILQYGKGKVAVFGEAAMFTAQVVRNNSGTFRFGFNASSAPNNITFIRQLMYWLSLKK